MCRGRGIGRTRLLGLSSANDTGGLTLGRPAWGRRIIGLLDLMRRLIGLLGRRLIGDRERRLMGVLEAGALPPPDCCTVAMLMSTADVHCCTVAMLMFRFHQERTAGVQTTAGREHSG